jgi:hypothetical protein
MHLQLIDPTDYTGWDSLLLRDEDHSFFHSSGWAKVLMESYGYKPVYFVSLNNGRLEFLMPMMEVSSPLTGKRGVSLPFSDECTIYATDEESVAAGVQGAIIHARKAGWRSIEWRQARFFPEIIPFSEAYFTHDIDLGKTEQDLFSSFKENNRRCIRKATKQGLSIGIGRSMDQLESFYRLNCLTRKRHGLPPQPFAFFLKVFDHIISQDSGILVSAFYAEKVVAAAVFFHFGNRAVFKYGASDIAHQHLRPNNLVMWEALKWYRERGFKMLNLGRTEVENRGLLQYKRGWGAAERLLAYIKFDIRKGAYLKNRERSGFPQRILFRTPVSILRLIGRMFYRHFG